MQTQAVIWTMTRPFIKLLAIAAFALYFFDMYQRFLGSSWGKRDFLAFWYGLQALSDKLNPYDFSQLKIVYDNAGVAASAQQLFLTPAWAVTLLSPFSWFEFENAAAFFAAFNCTLFLLLPIVLELKELGWLNQRPLVLNLILSLVVVCSFTPAFFCIYLGQLSIAVLACFILHLWLKERKYDICSGAVLSLTLIKPQLLTLYYLVFLLESLRNKRLKLLKGLVGSFCLLSLISFFCFDNIFQNYFKAELPTFYLTPTLGSWLQSHTKIPFISFAPLLLASIWLVQHVSLQAKPLRLEWIVLLLIPLNILVSPYLWSFDFCLLLPTALLIARIPTFSFWPQLFATLLFLSLPSLIVVLGVKEMHYALWFPILILSLGLFQLYQLRNRLAYNLST